MLRQLAPSAAKTGRGAEVVRLVPAALPPALRRPPAIPAAREPDRPGFRRRRHDTARHARTSEPRPSEPRPGRRCPSGRPNAAGGPPTSADPAAAAWSSTAWAASASRRSRPRSPRGSGGSSPAGSSASSSGEVSAAAFAGVRPGRGRLHRPGELRRQPVLRVGPVDRPRPGSGRPARHLDGQAADHLPAPVRPGRAGGPDPPRLPAPGPADPFRRRRAHHRAARDPAARRGRT